MLGVICQGLEENVCVQRTFISIKGSTPWINGDYPARYNNRFPSDTAMIDTDLPSQAETLRIRNDLYSRRFIATLLHFEGDKHWVAAVFDRIGSHLYFIDSLAKGRHRRASHAALAWRQFGANLGFFGPFKVVAPPQVEQPNGWACGYLAIVAIHQMLRSVFGWSLVKLALEWNVGIRYVGDWHLAWVRVYGPRRSALPFPDTSFGAATAKQGFSRSITLLKSILYNEIGIDSIEMLVGC